MGSSVVLNKKGDPVNRRTSRRGRRFQKNSPQRIRIRTSRSVRMGSGWWGSEAGTWEVRVFYMKFISRWWFQVFFYVHPLFGEDFQLTNIFLMG